MFKWFQRLKKEDSQEAQGPTETGPEKTVSSKTGFLGRLKERLSKTREGLVQRMDNLFLGRKEIDEELLEELEEILVTADLGVSTTQDILDDIRQRVSRRELANPSALRGFIKERLREILSLEVREFPGPERPYVVLIVGVNGVGKTTTIAKLAHYLKTEGKKVLLVAADTFRAAAIEQLETWGKRLEVPVVKHQPGADPSAVAYDGVEAAVKRNIDVVLIDTAGRLHTKVNLMEELKKIKRVIGKRLPGAPHEIWLVLDATVGQNATSQTKLFHEALGLTGLILTKLDGTAKGGVIVSICHDFSLPVRFIGVGEKMEDLQPFDPQTFVEALFGNET
ncbi:signal recognition particle-docking protein FtsY [Thermosulfuriphilus sp.]